MRNLSSTLAAAVNSRTRRPALAITAEDHINHLQQGLQPGNSDAFHSACVANDGSIIHVTLPRNGLGFTANFQWQRITDPTNVNQWTTWTTFGGASGNMYEDGCCTISNNSGILRAFAQQGTGGNAIWTWSSSDNGQTWSANPTVVLSPPGNALLRGISSVGNNDVFFMYDVAGPGEAIGCSFYNGTWGPLNTWTLPNLPAFFNTPGMTVAWNAAQPTTYYIIYSDFTSLKECTASSNGTTWTALPDIVPTTNRAIIRINPQISRFDGLYQLTCSEVDRGTYTGTAYQYPRVRQSADLQHWSNGFILPDMPAYYGAIYHKCAPPGTNRARYIVATMASVELGLDYQQDDATQFIDLSSHALEYRHEDEIGKASTITLMLDNSKSSLTSAVANFGTTYQPIGFNTTLTLSEGYYTGTSPTVPETIPTAKYHIKQIVFERAPSHSRISIEAEDLTKLLDYKNRYQVTYINQTLSWLISEICARAGLFNLALPATTQMSTSIVTFVLHAGQAYRQALDELCRVGWLEYFLDQNETLQFRELSPGDISVWSYTPEIETLALGSDDIRGNHVIVTGKPPQGTLVGALTNGEALDDTHIHVTGIEHIIVETDPKLTTPQLCARKAAFILQQEQRDQVAHSIQVPHNPALQLLDVITVHDQPPLAGTGQSAQARIFRNEVHFLPEKGQYELTLWLEGV